MILSGVPHLPISKSHSDSAECHISTLATDRGFKERVREDMLVRLLDAFVCRNYGRLPSLCCPDFSNTTPLDRQETQQLGFTYVQGMNVLAAPFLYTMPSELEAFFCFAKFIEQSCPLYVQPTLEGVHRGLKVVSSFGMQRYTDIPHSYSIAV
jgi:cell cycle arrest protein BUB2